MKDDHRGSREKVIEDEDGLCLDGQLSGLPTSKDVLNGDTAPADLCRSSSSGTLTVKNDEPYKASTIKAAGLVCASWRVLHQQLLLFERNTR